MFDLRNLFLGAAVFSLTFFVGWWLGLGRTTQANSVAGVIQPEPAAPANLIPFEPKLPFARRESAAAVAPVKQTPVTQGKGLTDNDGLRQAVLLRGKAHERPICNQDSKTLYIIAATKYAEVLMRSAGCNNFPKCPMGEGNLSDVWKLNRSAADVAVGEAMAKLHALGGLAEKDFRADVGRAVRVIAGREFNSGSGPACEQPSSRNGRWSVRIRR